MVRTALAFVLATGCGRIGFTDRAGGDAAIQPDAPPACTTFGAWSASTVLTALSSPQDDWGGQITPDGLALYFDSKRSGQNEPYVARRPDRSSAFGAPVAESELDGGSFTGNQSPTDDELEIYFDSSRSGSECLFFATRANVADPWGTPQSLFCSVGGAYVTPDGLNLYYNSILDVAQEGAIFVAARANRSVAFTPGAAVTGLGTTAMSGYPALSIDQDTIYFESETGTGGDLELWQATRGAPDETFGTAVRVPGIATGMEDVSITADGLELYYATPSPNADLQVSTRTCLD